jgi:mono/diheme cytochrome c family protein
MKHTTFRARALLAGTAALMVAHGAALADPAKGHDKSLIDRGRYLVKIAGCNDCHTPGYLPSEGKVDEKLWLTGDGFGWRGPWGTTYATNLRLFVADMSQAQWMQYLGTMRPRPPMPYFNVQAMNERDRKALYAYLKAMGPAGQPAPAWVPPGKQPPQPYAQFPG